MEHILITELGDVALSFKNVITDFSLLLGSRLRYHGKGGFLHIRLLGVLVLILKPSTVSSYIALSFHAIISIDFFVLKTTIGDKSVAVTLLRGSFTLLFNQIVIMWASRWMSSVAVLQWGRGCFAN